MMAGGAELVDRVWKFFLTNFIKNCLNDHCSSISNEIPLLHDTKTQSRTAESKVANREEGNNIKGRLSGIVRMVIK